MKKILLTLITVLHICFIILAAIRLFFTIHLNEYIAYSTAISLWYETNHHFDTFIFVALASIPLFFIDIIGAVVCLVRRRNNHESIKKLIYWLTMAILASASCFICFRYYICLM